ncbi:MAG: ABC transporter ATP-binding protein [Chloroflexi bacterium]|nr:ABC transporter ATP-binding protein [Chloroflexota bacterium]
MGITVQGLYKTYQSGGEGVPALLDVSLEVEDGEFFVLLGPSGSGKTTLLRSVAGLERPEGGSIYFDSTCVFSGDQNLHVRSENRQLGMVFQSYAIWPHLSVYQNVALPLTHGNGKIPRRLVSDRVNEALALVGLQDLGSRSATQLSGGQQQRVALARAMATKTERLLMDEPLSNLDARLREEVRAEVRTLIKGAGVTVLYVTHDQEEAMDLADRIAVMHQGRVLQVGSAEELYQSPADENVANFLGSMNWLGGSIGEDGAIHTSFGTVLASGASGLAPNARVRLGVRPEGIELGDDAGGNSGGGNLFSGEVLSSTFLGDHRAYEIKLADQVLNVRTPVTQLHERSVSIHIPEERVNIFPSDG